MTPKEADALHDRDPEAWNDEADKLGCGWMHLRQFIRCLNGLIYIDGNESELVEHTVVVPANVVKQISGL